MDKQKQETIDQAKSILKGAAATTEALLLLANQLTEVYDSFIHSGSIPDFLRKRFPATLPVKNGVEKDWIKQYVDTRHEWLSQHSKKILQGTIYRTQCFKNEIARDNWALAKVPIVANGVNVTD